MTPYKSFTRILPMTGLSNLGIVADGIFRGAQPDVSGYKTLHDALGVKTVICLREFNHGAEAAEAAGLKVLWHPMTVLTPASIEELKQIIDEMYKPENQPVYVHCQQGHDRTGLVCAAYRIKVNGWQLTEAEEEMKMYILYPFGELWLPIRHRLKEFAEEQGG